MPTVEKVRSLSDVEERAREAAKIVKAAEYKAKLERTKRDIAAVVLVKRDDELPIRVAELIGVSRGLMFRMFDHMEEADLPEIDDPRKTAEKAGKAVQKWDAQAEEAREIRDEAIMAMLGSPRWRNADVARITGLTTARIAQMRQGKR